MKFISHSRKRVGMHTVTDKKTEKALQAFELLSKIKAFSELGRQKHKNFKAFKHSKIHELEQYYQKIEILIQSIEKYPDFITAMGHYISHFQWIEKTLQDIHNQNHHTDFRVLDIHEIFEIKHFLYFYQKCINYLKSKNIIQIIPFRDFTDLFNFLDFDKQNIPAFHLNPGYSSELFQVFQTTQSYKHQIDEERNRLKQLLIQEYHLYDFFGKLTISRMNTEVLEKLSQCPYLSIENENFANVTFELKKNEKILQLEQLIAGQKDKLEEEEKNARQQITQKIALEACELMSAFNEIADFDLMLAKAIFSRNNSCCIPVISDNKLLKLKKLNHLILKDELKQLNLDYQPVDVCFNEKVVILTGANMAGKTSIIKSIGQAFILCSLGIPIPAEKAEMFLPDFIFFSGPINQEHQADLSSFAIEVVELQKLLEKKGWGLILMDEFARGTNPEEGTALSQAVIQYFSEHQKGNYICATHFNPPRDVNNTEHFRLIGISKDDFETLKNKDQTYLKNNLSEIHRYFNYQMIPVDVNSEVPKSAFMIADLLGLDPDILHYAQSYLKNEN